MEPVPHHHIDTFAQRTYKAPVHPDDVLITGERKRYAAVSWVERTVGHSKNSSFEQFTAYTARFDPPLDTRMVLYTGVKRERPPSVLQRRFDGEVLAGVTEGARAVE